MKPNNYYYRKIAEILNNTEYEKFYSSYYYMKAIAESYGYSYTGIKPTNKYLRDWHTEITGDTPSTFKNNLYYLYHIALALYPSTPASKNENYYLRIIYENIDAPTHVPTNLTWTLNGGSSTSAILSYADEDEAVFVFTVTDENDDPYQGYEIPIEVDGVAVSPSPVTDANGEATFTYESQGIGDVDIDVNCSLLIQTYSIRDDLFYDSMIDSIKNSWTKTSNQMTVSSDDTGTTISIGGSATDTPKLLYNLNSDNCIVEFDYISGTGSQQSFGFRIENSSHSYSSYLGYYSNKYRFGANTGNEKQITTSAPSNNHMKLEITPTSHKFYIDDTLIDEVTPSNSTTSKYIGFYMGYGNSSFKIKNVEIKPL